MTETMVTEHAEKMVAKYLRNCKVKSAIECRPNIIKIRLTLPDDASSRSPRSAYAELLPERDGYLFQYGNWSIPVKISEL